MVVETGSKTMMPKTLLKEPRHRRKKPYESTLRHLAESMVSIGQMHPIYILPTKEIVSGCNRWEASLLDDRISDLWVEVITDPITNLEIRSRRTSENIHRIGVSLYDKYLECSGFRDDAPGISEKEIADALNVDPSTITRYLCLDRCIEQVRQAVRDGKLGVKAVYEISKAEPERQKEMLEAALSGGAAHVTNARKGAAGTVPAAKAGKITVILPSGIVVTVSGSETLSIDGAIDGLAKALAELRDAKNKSKTAQEFMAANRERAKAGVKITGSAHSLTAEGVPNV